MAARPLALSLLFFLYTLFIAYRGEWQASDLVWSMWIASLVSGYIFILFSIVASMRPAPPPDPRASNWSEDLFAAQPEASLNTRIGLKEAVFLLLFFTLHFLGFHFGHGQIMQGFFPLAELDLSFPEQVRYTLSKYWTFVLVAIANLWSQLLELREANGKPRFEQPYIAVMRNHIMIFIVAIVGQFVSQPQLLYVLMIFYFFPFTQLRQWWRQRKAS